MLPPPCSPAPLGDTASSAPPMPSHAGSTTTSWRGCCAPVRWSPGAWCTSRPSPSPPTRTLRPRRRAAGVRIAWRRPGRPVRRLRLERGELAAAAEVMAGWPGMRPAMRAADFADGRSGSAAESLSRVRFAEHGLPAPRLQARLVGRRGADRLRRLRLGGRGRRVRWPAQVRRPRRALGREAPRGPHPRPRSAGGPVGLGRRVVPAGLALRPDRRGTARGGVRGLHAAYRPCALPAVCGRPAPTAGAGQSRARATAGACPPVRVLPRRCGGGQAHAGRGRRRKDPPGAECWAQAPLPRRLPLPVPRDPRRPP